MLSKPRRVMKIRPADLILARLPVLGVLYHFMCSHTVPQSQRHGHSSSKLYGLVDIKLRDVDHLHIDFINPVLWWKKSNCNCSNMAQHQLQHQPLPDR
jgi:hypothetical protein